MTDTILDNLGSIRTFAGNIMTAQRIGNLYPEMTRDLAQDIIKIVDEIETRLVGPRFSSSLLVPKCED